MVYYSITARYVITNIFHFNDYCICTLLVGHHELVCISVTSYNSYTVNTQDKMNDSNKNILRNMIYLSKISSLNRCRYRFQQLGFFIRLFFLIT